MGLRSYANRSRRVLYEYNLQRVLDLTALAALAERRYAPTATSAPHRRAGRFPVVSVGTLRAKAPRLERYGVTAMSTG
jgi:hypothetical protein